MGKSRALVAVMAAGISLAWLLPAQAQFWDWGNRPQRQQQQYNNNNNWFGGGGGWFGNDRRYDQRQEREAPVDYSRAPASTQKKPEATTPIVVVGDANADWLAYGLEDAFAEKPEINILRKHRTDSGLIRYDTRRDIEWPQVAREIIAADKPKFIVMMIGNNDRQTIREKAPEGGFIGSAGSTLADTLEKGGRYLEEQGLSGMGDDLTNLIRRNPVPALLVGIGLGYLIARATRS